MDNRDKLRRSNLVLILIVVMFLLFGVLDVVYKPLTHILDMSKITSGQMKLTPVSYHPGNMLSDIVGMLCEVLHRIDGDLSRECDRHYFLNVLDSSAGVSEAVINVNETVFDSLDPGNVYRFFH